jgi:uncharacterized protein YkwD
MRRLAAAVILVLAVGFGPSTAPVEAAAELSGPQQTVREQVNDTRRANGRRTLGVHPTITRRAQAWAEQLRQCQCLRHRRPPYGAVRGWYAVAENVGRSGDGGSLAGVHRAFMGSGGHRSNILGRRWTTMGVGVARDPRGEWFVVHVFADYSPN